MGTLKWTGLYEGVCKINKKHQFHTDTMDNYNVAEKRPGQLIGPSRVCCGHPIKYTKVMRDIEVANDKE